MPMMVPEREGGATRAYSASETGKTLANPALFKTWNANNQPIDTLSPVRAAIVAPATSESIPITAIKLPIAILLISVGSGNFLDQSPQKTTARNRKLTDTIESSVINHVVGIVFPKKTRLAWSWAHTR